MTRDDLQRMAEHDVPPAGDRIVNRGDAAPTPHEEYLGRHPEAARADEQTPNTDRAESLWDRTVEHSVASRAAPEVDAKDRRDVMNEAPRLFQDADLGDMRRRWSDIQAGFVDEPRRAVQQADALVSEATERLIRTFTSARERLEQQWARGDDGVTTEDLRVALQRYRAFFDRLLSM